MIKKGVRGVGEGVFFFLYTSILRTSSNQSSP